MNMDKKKVDKLCEQILSVRDTGKTNMFDACKVQRIANRRGFSELVIFIEEHRAEYADLLYTAIKDKNGWQHSRKKVV